MGRSAENRSEGGRMRFDCSAARGRRMGATRYARNGCLCDRSGAHRACRIRRTEHFRSDLSARRQLPAADPDRRWIVARADSLVRASAAEGQRIPARPRPVDLRIRNKLGRDGAILCFAKERFAKGTMISEEVVRAAFAQQKVMQTIGARLTRFAPGEIEIELPFRDDLTQQHGYTHAGIITIIVDSACGFAAYSLMPPNSEVLTVEYKLNFMDPASGEK